MGALSTENQQAFSAIIKPFAYPKNHVFLQQNQVSDYIYYLQKGAVRIFYHKNNKEVTEWLTLDDSFFLSINSFYNRAPSLLQMQTLEPSQLWGIPHAGFMQLSSQSHEVETLHRGMVTYSLLLSQQRMESLQFETAKSRYQALIKNRPDFIQRIPLSYIASFLGITLETLSRMRASE